MSIASRGGSDSVVTVNGGLSTCIPINDCVIPEELGVKYTVDTTSAPDSISGLVGWNATTVSSGVSSVPEKSACRIERAGV